MRAFRRLTQTTAFLMVLGGALAVAIAAPGGAQDTGRAVEAGIIIVVDDQDPDSLPKSSNAYRKAAAILGAGLEKAGYTVVEPSTALAPETAKAAAMPRNFSLSLYRNGLIDNEGARVIVVLALTIFATAQMDDTAAMTMNLQLEATAFDRVDGALLAAERATGPEGEAARLPETCDRACVLVSAEQFTAVAAEKLAYKLPVLLTQTH